MTRNRLISEIIRDEGSRKDEAGRHVAYKDSLGKWTIGYGHLLAAHRDWTNYACTEEEARRLLNLDLDVAEAGARRIFPSFDSLSDERQRALVNMVFNRGEARVATSARITPAIQKAIAGTGPWSEVMDAIQTSEWREQVGARADRLAVQLRGVEEVSPGGVGAPHDEGFA